MLQKIVGNIMHFEGANNSQTKASACNNCVTDREEILDLDVPAFNLLFLSLSSPGACSLPLLPYKQQLASEKPQVSGQTRALTPLPASFVALGGESSANHKVVRRLSSSKSQQTAQIYVVPGSILRRRPPG